MTGSRTGKPLDAQEQAVTARPTPDWLAVWQTQGASPPEAVARFDSLPGADPDDLAGLWQGRTLPTGHPLDGLLEALGWYGKAVLRNGQVHPLLFRRPSGQLVALDPAWMPAELALRWPALARSPATRIAFQALSPLLRARSPSARIRSREFRSRRGAALVYDRQPITDHLCCVDDGRLVGLMERRGMAAPYFFLLRRAPAAPTCHDPALPSGTGKPIPRRLAWPPVRSAPP